MFKAIALLTLAVLVACAPGEGALTPPAVTPRPSVAVSSPTSSPVASASAAPRSSSPAASPSPAPATASPTPSSAPPGACATSATGAILGEQALIVGVRVGSHEGYDRVVFEFASRHAPAAGGSTFEIGPATPPFLQDASGLPLTVAGDTVFKVVLRGATAVALDGTPSYTGSRDFTPGFPILRQLRGAGDFEAVSSWFIGVNGTGCVQAQTLTAPTRLVIDLRHP